LTALADAAALPFYAVAVIIAKETSRDGGQVDQGAHAGLPPEAGQSGRGAAIKKAWATLVGRLRGQLPRGMAVRPMLGDAFQRTLRTSSAWGARATARMSALRDAVRARRVPALGWRGYVRLAVPYARFAVRAAAAVVAVLVVTVLVLVGAYRWVDPPISTLMLGQSIIGVPIERTWVPIERMSPHLVKAVILSEDGSFCSHRGVDLHALQEAMASDRGGSTITMQVVKNLFLWPSRSYVRKAIEIGLAYVVDFVWPKRRILEIYLNIAEWGDGVFGAEAAARAHFGKSAARLTPAEAALMAVALPSPLERTPGQASPGIKRLAGRLMLRMAASRVSLACVRSAPRRQSALPPKAQAKAPPKPAAKPDQKGAEKGNWDYLFPGTD
jgi:monofunctional biosynthetic peptidoglycan transglycosylase